MFDGVAPIRQASAVPFRKRGGRVEFCLITTSKRKRWGFPKGIVDPGETPRETALKEALEEAGLHGRLEADPLGHYQYRKWGTVLSVACFLMEVTAADDNWPEADSRGRRWHTAEKARQMIDRDPLIELLDGAVRRIGS
jgi:phosphohistidine phosphatase